ncbi:GNAT family N-acetyltransferase [Terrilactibacillus sp. BCM23-1]|uniref:GNAT family N-acetyltransferase n=1 Tax=Terrilactibacillus tamarindi TaxID=2599694 RepID=A0A6N8CPU3_9BACI|nr:GNAT family N-acetyltransferase [Terrilactibacillus tamarindi]MTT30925.1 GNAT family N-acetyltransferase [Terrilactibacillus tamarindi]
MSLFLVKPTVEYEKEYLDFYHEWKQSGETMIPWVIEKDPSDFPRMVQSLLDSEKGIGLPDSWVPDSTYWLMDVNHRILGVSNIRHRLTEQLLNCGGHIGYGIRPTERRKGFATKLLNLSIEKAKQLGIDRILVVCDASNLGSKKIILKNGGVEDFDFVEEDGNVVKRYWID